MRQMIGAWITIAIVAGALTAMIVLPQRIVVAPECRADAPGSPRIVDLPPVEVRASAWALREPYGNNNGR